MPHFFIKVQDIDLENNLIIIKDVGNYHHIARALRARVGEALLLIDENQIQYETVIEKITKSEIYCSIKKNYPSMRDLGFNLFLAQAPLRSEAQLTLIEKATELGVRGIYPVMTDNCAVKKDVVEAKIEKWQKVMYEASKQCERAKIPTCFKLTTLENLIKQKFDRVIVFAERSTEQSLKTYLRLKPIRNQENILVIIGPEGGFSQKEFDFFNAQKFPLISLGNLILKAETAVIVALGDVIYEYQG